MLEVLLEHSTPATDKVFKAAASFPYGEYMMKLLLEQRRDQIRFTPRVIRHVARYHYPFRNKMALIVQYEKAKVEIPVQALEVALESGCIDIFEEL